MTEKQRAVLAVEALKKEYPDAICSLTYTEPLQLLIATRLSAQCTDARVNMVTPALFERFPTLNAFCDGPVEDIEEIIRSCGLYKTKARDIYAMCNKLRSDYNGVVPDTVEELTKLPGVGRKTANLVVGDTNFQRLHSEMEPVEAHLCAKQIVDRYQELISTKQIIGGMFLFTEPNGLYREIYGGAYSYSLKEQMLTYFEQLTQSGSIDRSRWQVLSLDGQAFLYRVLGTNGVYSICAVDLDMLLAPQDSTDPSSGVLLYTGPDGTLLTSVEWAQGANIQIQYTDDAFYLTGAGKYLAVQDYSDVAGVWFVYLTPYQNLFHQMDFLLLFLMSAVLLILLLVCCYILKGLFLKPMDHLVQTMNAIKSGDLDAKMETNYRVMEFQQMSDTFNGMMEEIKSLKISAYEKELELQQAQLQYLQIQIRPHFFLNCLKNLYALAQEQQYDRIQRMILALSDYLRYLFSNNMTFVPLQDELRSVKRYLLLEQMSASCPPVCEIDADERLLDFQVPPMSILTFVENSVKHASLPGEALSIYIKVMELKTEDAQYINISISDNGSGFPPETLEKLNRAEKIEYTGQHVGILNVKHRFALLYQGKSIFSFSNLKKGSRIELFIPEEGGNDDRSCSR